MAALLTSETSKPENVVKYIGECKEMNIRVEPPDVQVSGAQFTPHISTEGESIRFGLAAVKNVGGNAIESIMKARTEVGGRFKSLWEFCEKVDLRVMNKRVIESLIKAGALDALGARAALYKSVDKRWSARRRLRKMPLPGSTGSLACSMIANPGRDADDLPRIGGLEEGERLANEKEVLGFFVSGHPLDKYAEKLRNLSGVISTAEALERKPPEKRWGAQADPPMSCRWWSAGGYTAEKEQKDQKLYAQGYLEDATGKIEVICFLARLRKAARQLKIEAPVIVAAS